MDTGFDHRPIALDQDFDDLVRSHALNYPGGAKTERTGGLNHRRGMRRLPGMNTVKLSSRKPQKRLIPDRARPAQGRKRKMVLLVDDEAVLREMMKTVLEWKCAVKAFEAGSGEQALRMAKRRDFDLVISDYGRPGMDGLTFLREFKAQHPRVPVIMLTGQAAAIRQRARRLGASSILSKPFKVTKLGYFERFLR